MGRHGAKLSPGLCLQGWKVQPSLLPLCASTPWRVTRAPSFKRAWRPSPAAMASSARPSTPGSAATPRPAWPRSLTEAPSRGHALTRWPPRSRHGLSNPPAVAVLGPSTTSGPCQFTRGAMTSQSGPCGLNDSLCSQYEQATPNNKCGRSVQTDRSKNLRDVW